MKNSLSKKNIYLKNISEYLVLWAVGGCIYYGIEVLFRGFSHISMFMLGGLCMQFFTWQGRLTEAFLEKIHADDGILVNLASSEMKRLFDWKRIRREARIITPEFRIREGDRLKTIVVYTKMCRGEMTRHLIRNRITDPEMLKEFEWEGFRFDAALSRGDDWTFTM